MTTRSVNEYTASSWKNIKKCWKKKENSRGNKSGEYEEAIFLKSYEEMKRLADKRGKWLQQQGEVF